MTNLGEMMEQLFAMKHSLSSPPHTHTDKKRNGFEIFPTKVPVSLLPDVFSNATGQHLFVLSLTPW